MNKKIFVLLMLCALTTGQSALIAATIPAGTALVVRTTQSISTHERRGRTFKTKLDHNLALKGNVLLRGGTEFVGVVEASRGGSTRSSPLKLNLTGVVLNGRTVPIKTTTGVEAKPPAITARQSHFGHTAGKFTFSAGLQMQFLLAEPLNF